MTEIQSPFGYYRLEGKETVPCGLYDSNWMDPTVKHVGDTTRFGIRVSTVFLGLDHNLGGYGPPLLFETMVFGGPLNEHCIRYSTVDQAAHGHAQLCKRAHSPWWICADWVVRVVGLAHPDNWWEVRYGIRRFVRRVRRRLTGED